MLDHLSIAVSDLERGRQFYDAVFAPLGYRRVNDLPSSCGYGPDKDHDDFYIVRAESGAQLPRAAAYHVALAAPDRPAVDAFHRAALKIGATDDGPPGLRKQYHENYYAAYIIDPDGNRIEAVCHRPA